MAQTPGSQHVGNAAPLRHHPLTPADDRLLVVDDDASICALLAKFGEKAGFAVTQALSLDDATRALRERRFDCITLDLNIGRNSGLQLLRLLADMACNTPIVVISGSLPSVRDLAAAVGNMMQLNILEPVPKPIDFAKIKSTFSAVKAKLEAQRNGHRVA